MSKAFAPGESDSDEERDIIKAPVLPPGVRNYITPAGAEQLEAERERLIAQKAALGEESLESKPRRRVLDRKIDFLNERLNRAQIINPSAQPKDRVLFGAEVTIRDQQEKRQVWRIVGVDEMNLDKGWVSWLSPIAAALLEKKVGETAILGDRKMTVIKILY